MVSLDPSLKVVEAACEKGVDLLVTHHPLIFHPLKSIDFATPAGLTIKTAIAGGLAVFSAHTNLDIARGGVNDALADKIGLKSFKVLGDRNERGKYKFVVYAPPEYEARIMEALFETEAGKIGEYACCSFRARGKGTFMPGSSSTPFIGKPGKFSEADEIRIETVALKKDLPAVLSHIKSVHPYETMAYDVYPLCSSEGGQGIGRVGDLERETRLGVFAGEVGKKLGLKSAKIAGSPDLPVKKIALCAGSGSGMVKNFIASGADFALSVVFSVLFRSCF